MVIDKMANCLNNKIRIFFFLECVLKLEISKTGIEWAVDGEMTQKYGILGG